VQPNIKHAVYQLITAAAAAAAAEWLSIHPHLLLFRVLCDDASKPRQNEALSNLSFIFNCLWSVLVMCV